MPRTCTFTYLLVFFLSTSVRIFANQPSPTLPAFKDFHQTAIISNNVLHPNSPSKDEFTIIYQAGTKSRLRSDSLNYENDRIRRKAKWAKFLGIGSLVGLLLPVVGVLSLPAAIVAIITGNQAKKDAPDKKSLQDAKTGVITGWVTVGLFVLAILLVILIIAALTDWN